MQLDLRDAARLLGVDENTVTRWVRRGELAASRVHDQYRFHRVDLLEFAAERGIQIPPEVVSQPSPGGPVLPSLADALRAGGVHADLAGRDKAAVLAALVERLPLPRGVDRGLLLRMMLAREQLGSTGMGDGIAIPHPRSPVVLPGAAPAAAVAYLASPIDFGALDGRPVHTLFALVAPSVRVHLHLLALLATALRHPEVAALLEARAPAAELLPAIAAVEAALPRRAALPDGKTS